MEATMHEAKTNLSKLVERALAGEDVVLTRGKERKPIARIVAVDPISEDAANLPKFRPLGLFAEEMRPSGDINWFEPMSEEELALWEAPIVSTRTTNEPPYNESE